jgi:hypothetical protein
VVAECRWRSPEWCNFPGPPRRLSQLDGRISGDWLRLALQEVGRSIFSPGLSITSTTRTIPKSNSAGFQPKTIQQGSTAGELTPELARYGLQQPMELEVAAVIGADRHERTEERHGYRNRYSLCSLTTQVGDINGVTTRIVDALVAAPGSQSGISNAARGPVLFPLGSTDHVRSQNSCDRTRNLTSQLSGFMVMK